MKKISKMMVITLIIAMCMVAFALPVVKVNADASSTLSQVTITEPTSDQTKGLATMAGQIIGIIRVAAAIAAVVLVAVFGFKFIMGSAEEKKDYMASFIPLIVGVVVVFSATFIADLIFSVADASKTSKYITPESSYVEVA